MDNDDTILYDETLGYWPEDSIDGVYDNDDRDYLKDVFRVDTD